MRHIKRPPESRAKVRRYLAFIFLVLIAGAIYQFRHPLAIKLEPVWNSVDRMIVWVSKEIGIAPCAKPLSYSLGSFDAKFGISKPYFLSALADAEAIWEKPWGNELFTHVPDTGELKVNLVYDYRQEATNTLKKLGITVKNNQASYDALKVKYDTVQSQYNRALATFKSRVAAFDAKRDAYEAQVDYWNKRGGAPRKEYEALQVQGSALDAEGSALEVEQSRMNEMVSEINALAVALNQLVDSLKLSVNKYNAVGSSRGESFTEGLYQRQGLDQQIDVYEFSDRQQLVKVLAHELGHALRLEHVEDPAAIMYSLNQGTNIKATPADMAELSLRCGK